MPLVGDKINEVEVSTKVKVKETSTEVRAENKARNGLEIVNESTGKIFLKLGAAAVAEEGLYLAPGGSWDGRIGPILWTGSVFGISASGAGENNITVTEV